MFCPKCGNQLPDGSAFCGKCGAQLDPNRTVPQPAMAAPAASTEKAKTPIKLPMIIALAAAGLAIVALLVFVVPKIFGGSQGSPEKCVKGAYEEVLDLDFKGFMKYMPDAYIDYLCDQAGVSNQKALIAAVDAEFDAVISELEGYGVNAKKLFNAINVEVNGSSKLSDDELDALRARWNKQIPGFGDKIKDAAYVNVALSADPKFKLNVMGQEVALADIMGTSTQQVLTVKIGGKWYVLDSEMMDLGGML
ncbi:MAG: zinc-ribbon domain-containing protein [Coriobacteriales bacterium]|nr:zinc-ribbon domain-containing protein [Coriobacteriales bacterium]